MLIAHAIINTLDLFSKNVNKSNQELDFSKDLTDLYVNKIVKKVLASSKKRKGKFNDTSKLYNLVKTFNKDTNFIKFSHEISDLFFEELSKSDSYVRTDILILEYRENNDDVLSIILLENEESITVSNNEDNIQLSKNLNNLPTNVNSINTFILIDLNTFEFYSSEKFKMVEGTKHKIVEENLVDASFEPSTSDIYKVIKKEAMAINDSDSIKEVETLAKLKQHINNHSDSPNLDVIELAEDLFKDKTKQQEFLNNVKLKGVNENASLEYSLVTNKTLNSKIKTDTGIELTIPNDYFSDTNNVEIKDNSDGTFSIIIKNITKLSGR